MGEPGSDERSQRRGRDQLKPAEDHGWDLLDSGEETQEREADEPGSDADDPQEEPDETG